MFGLRRTTPSLMPPVQLSDVRAQARVDLIDATVYEQLTGAATELVENFTRRSLITQSWTLSTDCFPTSALYLPRGPVQTITEIRYVDPDGLPQVVAPTVYALDTGMGRLTLGYEQAWPASRSGPGHVEIEYVAGFGPTPDDVPVVFRQAVLVLVTQFYDDPGGSMPMSPGIKAMLGPYRYPVDIEAA